MKGSIWTVVVIALALALGASAVNIGYSNAAAPGNATENATVDYDVNYTVENADAYEFTSLNVTSNGTELREGTDFEFDVENGTVNWINSVETTDGDAATVAYDFRDHSDTTQNQRNYLALVSGPLGLLLMIVALGALFVSVFRDPY